MDARIIAIALLAVVAGCGSITGPDGPATTVTPAPVATPTPDASGIQLAPGLTSAGIEDPGALIERHRRVLTQQSFRWNQELMESPPDLRAGHRTISRSRWVIYQNASAYHTYRSAVNPDRANDEPSIRDFEMYVRGGDTYLKWRYTGEENRTYERFDTRSSPQYLAVPAIAFQRFLAFDSQTVRRIDAGNRTHYRVRGTQSSLTGIEGAEDIEATAVIRTDGLIRSLEVSYVRSAGAQTIRVSYTSTYSDIGTTTVTDPAWLSAARASLESG